jgi:sulfatase maturation enzyme AslB (radical SAM superfamily)
MSTNTNIETFKSATSQSAYLIPRRVTIETVFACNASCIMCPIDLPSKRIKGTMKQALFEKIIDSLVPHNDQIEMMDLFGLGEPLLDKKIFDRIKYVKDKGFRNIAISTNADLMDEGKQDKLLASGIDTLIFSIDGFKKRTHEAIRVNLDYDKVLENCLSIINKRDELDSATKFVIRFIRQDSNREEWLPFKEFWTSKLQGDKGDLIVAYNVHTFGGSHSSKDGLIGSEGRVEEIERKPCDLIFDILYILADGTVPLCNEDWLDADYRFGNCNDTDPIEIFNAGKFHKVRERHACGEKAKMKICGDCTLHYSMATREVITL